MAKKKYSITVAGGGSTFTPGIVLMLLDHMTDSQFVPSSFMITMQRDRKQLQKHVRSI